MGEYWNLERLTEEWVARGLSRRDLCVWSAPERVWAC